MEIHEKAWLIDFQAFMEKVNLGQLDRHYELPKMRNIKQCVELWNKKHKRKRQIIDKHTVERCMKEDIDRKIALNIMQITDYDESIRRFKEWIKIVESLKIPEFRDCTKAYRRWFWGIAESFRVPYSNGFTEGKNNKIKVLKRNAFGFRNFDNYKKRILLTA